MKNNTNIRGVIKYAVNHAINLLALSADGQVSPMVTARNIPLSGVYVNCKLCLCSLADLKLSTRKETT
jgi:hypothetical protein